MRLIFVRHGETIENREGVIQGQTLQGELTERGKEQAKRAAERLRNEDIDTIYSSDLDRALDTAKEISRLHPEADFESREELREGDFGRFGGLEKTEETKEERGRILFDPEKSFEDGEGIRDIETRLTSLLQETLERHEEDTVDG